MQKKELFDLLVGHTKRFLLKLDGEDVDITSDTHFVSLGASSCDRAVILAETLESLSVNESLEDILNASTVGEMNELIYEKLYSNESERLQITLN